MIVEEWVQAIRPSHYGPFTAGPPRSVGHCTDGPWGSIAFQLNANLPHYHCVLDVRPASGRERRTYQTCLLNERCGGMKQPPSSTGVITNRRSAIQWSIAGPASQMHTLTEEECHWIGTQLRPIRRFYPSITVVHRPAVGPGDHSGAIATPTWSGRYTREEWDVLDGWTQHQRAPYNDHYDIYCHEWQFAAIIAAAHQEAEQPPQGDTMILDVGSFPLAATPGAEGIASIQAVGNGARVLAVDGGVFDVGVPAVGNAFNFLSTRRSTHYASGFDSHGPDGFVIVIRQRSNDAVTNRLVFGTPKAETVDKDTLVGQYIDGPSTTFVQGWKRVIA